MSYVVGRWERRRERVMFVRISYGKFVRNIVGSMWICILCASCRWVLIIIRVQLLYSSVNLYLFNVLSVAGSTIVVVVALSVHVSSYHVRLSFNFFFCRCRCLIYSCYYRLSFNFISSSLFLHRCLLYSCYCPTVVTVTLLICLVMCAYGRVRSQTTTSSSP